MIYHVTTDADEAMGNEPVEIEAATPALAAAEHPVRACDYATGDADAVEALRSEDVEIIVYDEDYDELLRVQTVFA